MWACGCLWGLSSHWKAPWGLHSSHGRSPTPHPLRGHALTGAGVDSVLANLTLIVRSKEWWFSPNITPPPPLTPESIKFISVAAQGFFFSPSPPLPPAISPALEQYSTVPWASQSELTGVNLSGLFSLLLPLSRSHSLPLFHSRSHRRTAWITDSYYSD